MFPDPKKLPRKCGPIAAEPEDRKPRSEDSRTGEAVGSRQGKGVGQGRGHLRLGASEGEIPERPTEGSPGGAEGRHGRLRRNHVAVYRHLPSGQHPRPARFGCPAIVIPSSTSKTTKGKATGFRASRPAPANSAESKKRGPSCKRATISAHRKTAKSASVTWRNIWPANLRPAAASRRCDSSASRRRCRSETADNERSPQGLERPHRRAVG